MGEGGGGESEQLHLFDLMWLVRDMLKGSNPFFILSTLVIPAILYILQLAKYII